eukprot:GHVR01092738.1.p1 GENE.GHVR01092738.1~~GHVR01092738.1.p1  ORF type:complete len:377 (+),score=200.94 GHVR01092738.1:234-1364(+)
MYSPISDFVRCSDGPAVMGPQMSARRHAETAIVEEAATTSDSDFERGLEGAESKISQSVSETDTLDTHLNTCEGEEKEHITLINESKNIESELKGSLREWKYLVTSKDKYILYLKNKVNTLIKEQQTYINNIGVDKITLQIFELVPIEIHPPIVSYNLDYKNNFILITHVDTNRDCEYDSNNVQLLKQQQIEQNTQRNIDYNILIEQINLYKNKLYQDICTGSGIYSVSTIIIKQILKTLKAYNYLYKTAKHNNISTHVGGGILNEYPLDEFNYINYKYDMCDDDDDAYSDIEHNYYINNNINNNNNNNNNNINNNLMYIPNVHDDINVYDDIHTHTNNTHTHTNNTHTNNTHTPPLSPPSDTSKHTHTHTHTHTH